MTGLKRVVVVVGAATGVGGGNLGPIAIVPGLHSRRPAQVILITIRPSFCVRCGVKATTRANPGLRR